MVMCIKIWPILEESQDFENHKIFPKKIISKMVGKRSLIRIQKFIVLGDYIIEKQILIAIECTFILLPSDGQNKIILTAKVQFYIFKTRQRLIIMTP